MQKEQIDNYAAPLIVELETVLKRGLRTILKDFINRYDMLERTHQQLMNLPSIRNEFNEFCVHKEKDETFILNKMNQLEQKIVSKLDDKVEKLFNQINLANQQP